MTYKQNNTLKILSLLIFVLMLPAVSLAAGLVPCGGRGEDPCTFNDFLTLVNKVIDFLLFDLSLPLSAILFAYAGFLYLTTSVSDKKAKAF